MIKEFIFVILVGALANMVPVFVKKWKFLGYPVDFGLKFKGCRVFGSNKTWRGLFWGILISWYVLSIFVDNFNWDVSYYLGLWIPIGVLGGDLVGKAYGGYDEQSLKADIGIGQNPENVILNNDNPSSSGS